MIEAALIVLVLAVVVFALVRPRGEPPTATMESGQSHMRGKS